jgi:hypothetical protein
MVGGSGFQVLAQCLSPRLLSHRDSVHECSTKVRGSESVGASFFVVHLTVIGCRTSSMLHLVDTDCSTIDSSNFVLNVIKSEDDTQLSVLSGHHYSVIIHYCIFQGTIPPGCNFSVNPLRVVLEVHNCDFSRPTRTRIQTINSESHIVTSGTNADPPLPSQSHNYSEFLCLINVCFFSRSIRFIAIPGIP